MKTTHRHQRGASLLEALIAFLVLSLGMLGMIRLQGKGDGKGALAAWQKLLKSNPQLSADRKAQVQKLMADVLNTLGDTQAAKGGTGK